VAIDCNSDSVSGMHELCSTYTKLHSDHYHVLQNFGPVLSNNTPASDPHYNLIHRLREYLTITYVTSYTACGYQSSLDRGRGHRLAGLVVFPGPVEH